MSTGLEQQAASRKERLAQLRSLKRKSENDTRTLEKEEEKEREKDKTPESTISGRNFDTENRAPKLGFNENPIENEETVEIVAERVQKETLASLESKNSSDILDLSNLQPKGVNWDLKRDLESKFAILDTRTDDAIIRLVHERLKATGKTSAD